LRRKHASFDVIAQLLTEHCLPTSKSTIVKFCHEVLGEKRLRRNRSRRNCQKIETARGSVTTSSVASGPVPAPSLSSQADTMNSNSGPVNQPNTPRPRGPRIASVRMLKTQASS